MRRTLVLGILLGLLISGVAGLILVSTLPTDEEIQRISLEELGVDQQVLTNPLLAGIVETFFTPVQESVRKRVVDDVRDSVLLACAGVVAVTALGVTLIAADARRRSPRQEAPGVPAEPSG